MNLPATAEETRAFGQSFKDWPAFPDSAEALAYLKQHYKLVVLSNIDRASFAHSNKKLGVTFDAVVTAQDVGSYKPALRHFEAKIHWIERLGPSWVDLGPVLPDFAVPYEREWAGSALLDDGVLSLFFTAAGTAARSGGYQQQLWASSAPLGADGWPDGWSIPAPVITGYGPHYMPADAHEGEAGKIKAFRDPAYFRDPADGTEYLAFTASLGQSDNAFNGAFGLAVRGPLGWVLAPPCLHADGVNNELERAHLVFYGKHYYAFWSTQTATFAPGLRHAPGGLYGMVADSMAGPWRPLNGSGLVLANPADCPQQTYSWYVDADLTVCSLSTSCPMAALAACQRRCSSWCWTVIMRR
ncbi:MAG: HAD hydrolase-like protein [Sphingomonadales bacterium]|nr:HAD hydrolase-like protein [Sphingomonadales bacterium]